MVDYNTWDPWSACDVRYGASGKLLQNLERTNPLTGNSGCCVDGGCTNVPTFFDHGSNAVAASSCHCINHQRYGTPVPERGQIADPQLVVSAAALQDRNALSLASAVQADCLTESLIKSVQAALSAPWAGHSENVRPKSCCLPAVLGSLVPPDTYQDVDQRAAEQTMTQAAVRDTIAERQQAASLVRSVARHGARLQEKQVPLALSSQGTKAIRCANLGKDNGENMEHLYAAVASWLASSHEPLPEPS